MRIQIVLIYEVYKKMIYCQIYPQALLAFMFKSLAP
jgi:hypothetical protein